MTDRPQGSARAAFLLGVSAVLVAGEAAAQARGEWRNAQHLFESSCVYCHTTGVAPTLYGRGLPRDYVFSRVREGYGPMPAFKPSEFSDDELEALRQWLNEQPLEN